MDKIEELIEEFGNAIVCNTMQYGSGQSQREIYKREDAANVARQALLDAYSRWIPISERLPEDENIVLATDGESVMEVKYYDGEVKGFYIGDICENFYPLHEWTHWMPKPEPPKIVNEPNLSEIAT